MFSGFCMQCFLESSLCSWMLWERAKLGWKPRVQIFVYLFSLNLEQIVNILIYTYCWWSQWWVMGASHYCCHSWWHLTVGCFVAFVSLRAHSFFLCLIDCLDLTQCFLSNYCCGVFLHKDRRVNLHPLANNPQFLCWFFAKFTKLFLTKSWKQCVFFPVWSVIFQAKSCHFCWKF